MKKTAVVVLAAVLVAGAAAQDLWHDESTRPSAGDYAAEAGGALLGGALVGAGATVVLGVAGAALASAASPYDDWAGLGGLVIGGATGVAVGYPLGCGLGATLVGRATHADGNTGGAYAGAYLGLLAVLPAYVLIAATVSVGRVAVPHPEAAVGCVAALLPPIGAVIGYNTGVRGKSSQSSLGARLAPPTLAYSTRLGPDRQRYSAFDCRLVTVRF
jgi:hypothetical protein